jgi:hypothetical protein
MPRTNQRSYRPAKLVCLGAMLSIAVWVGCGADNPLGRQAISGTVTLDGQPIAAGSIEFAPRQHGGVGSGAMITAGSYQIAAAKGLPPGKYLVRIFAPEDAQAAPAEPSVPGPTGPSQPPPGVERIPPEYNAKSDKVVEVTAAGPNEFDFAIQTK